MKTTLVEIVRNRDLQTLESVALSMTYRQLMERADAEGVDRAELEELLYEIS